MILKKFPDLVLDFVHHLGNSSGVVDGAAAILVTSPDYAKAHGLTPRARVLATANMGDDPTLMINAPGPAARNVVARAGLTLDDIDLFEDNAALADVVEKFIPHPKPQRPPRPALWHARVPLCDEPSVRFVATGPAASTVVARAGLTLVALDRFELYGAFAVVVEKFIRDLEFGREKNDGNGVAMALGHPIGATGSMLIGS